MKIRKIILLLVTLVVACFVVYLSLPTSFYVRKALVHRNARIDHYQIFHNRVVKAANPQPWQLDECFNQSKIPEDFQAYFADKETVAFLVIRGNRILFEKYWDGYSAESHSNSFSMAKSILSILVGCAIDDGLIKSVQQPVSDFLPQWTAVNSDTLRIVHLLTMSAGLKWEEGYSSVFSPTTKAYYGDNLWELTLQMHQIEKPGVRYVYQSGASQLLGFLLQKATGRTISDYASEKLWTPIGAEQDALWSLDKEDGMEKTYCCYHSNARDFARIGQLLLNKGKWSDKQVVDSAYLAVATTPSEWLSYTPTAKGVVYAAQPCGFYGYQFWIANHRGLNIQYMCGILGQYVFAIPELDAVIVRLGHQRDEEENVFQNRSIDTDVWLDAGIAILND